MQQTTNSHESSTKQTKNSSPKKPEQKRRTRKREYKTSWFDGRAGRPANQPFERTSVGVKIFYLMSAFFCLKRYSSLDEKTRLGGRRQVFKFKFIVFSSLCRNFKLKVSSVFFFPSTSIDFLLVFRFPSHLRSITLPGAVQKDAGLPAWPEEEKPAIYIFPVVCWRSFFIDFISMAEKCVRRLSFFAILIICKLAEQFTKKRYFPTIFFAKIYIKIPHIVSLAQNSFYMQQLRQKNQFNCDFKFLLNKYSC